MKIRFWCLETIPIRTYSTNSHSNLVNRTYCPEPLRVFTSESRCFRNNCYFPSASSYIVYCIKCPGCDSSNVGQTVRHLTTRLHEHQRSSAPVSQHLEKCAPNVTSPTAKILDRTRNASKLLTLEYIDRLSPALKQPDEFRLRQLTLKI